MKAMSNPVRGLFLILFLLSIGWWGTGKFGRLVATEECANQVLEHYGEVGINEPEEAFLSKKEIWINLRHCLMKKCFEKKGYPSLRRACHLDKDDAPIYNAFQPH